jgi:hypothetical protein
MIQYLLNNSREWNKHYTDTEIINMANALNRNRLNAFDHVSFFQRKGINTGLIKLFDFLNNENLTVKKIKNGTNIINNIINSLNNNNFLEFDCFLIELKLGLLLSQYKHCPEYEHSFNKGKPDFYIPSPYPFTLEIKTPRTDQIVAEEMNRMIALFIDKFMEHVQIDIRVLDIEYKKSDIDSMKKQISLLYKNSTFDKPCHSKYFEIQLTKRKAVKDNEPRTYGATFDIKNCDIDKNNFAILNPANVSSTIKDNCVSTINRASNKTNIKNIIKKIKEQTPKNIPFIGVICLFGGISSEAFLWIDALEKYTNSSSRMAKIFLISPEYNNKQLHWNLLRIVENKNLKYKLPENLKSVQKHLFNSITPHGMHLRTKGAFWPSK